MSSNSTSFSCGGSTLTGVFSITFLFFGVFGFGFVYFLLDLDLDLVGLFFVFFVDLDLDLDEEFFLFPPFFLWLLLLLDYFLVLFEDLFLLFFEDLFPFLEDFEDFFDYLLVFDFDLGCLIADLIFLFLFVVFRDFDFFDL